MIEYFFSTLGPGIEPGRLERPWDLVRDIISFITSFLHISYVFFIFNLEPGGIPFSTSELNLNNQ